MTCSPRRSSNTPSSCSLVKGAAPYPHHAGSSLQSHISVWWSGYRDYGVLVLQCYPPLNLLQNVVHLSQGRTEKWLTVISLWPAAEGWTTTWSPWKTPEWCWPCHVFLSRKTGKRDALKLRGRNRCHLRICLRLCNCNTLRQRPMPHSPCTSQYPWKTSHMRSRKWFAWFASGMKGARTDGLNLDYFVF